MVLLYQVKMNIPMLMGQTNRSYHQSRWIHIEKQARRLHQLPQQIRHLEHLSIKRHEPHHNTKPIWRMDGISKTTLQTPSKTHIHSRSPPISSNTGPSTNFLTFSRLWPNLSKTTSSIPQYYHKWIKPTMGHCVEQPTRLEIIIHERKHPQRTHTGYH